jgi:hypothetical protein
MAAEPKPPTVTLVAFRDGSYKRVQHVGWKHSQWIHYSLRDGSTLHVNPANVNYLHDEAPEPPPPAPLES